MKCLKGKLVILILLPFLIINWEKSTSWAFEENEPDLTELSLEALMDIDVTLAGRKQEKQSKTAAAVFVITCEDIRRSGVTNIPEALRMAPGLHVAKIESGKWAITVRGFNGRFANKLLVMIDGRPVYSHLFSGVFWEAQDTLIEDIDRIEIIRGPGASLWGANAVNGIINIITKHSEDTQDNLVMFGYGTEERDFAGVRHGGKLGENATYRIYTKYFNRDESVDTNGDNFFDDWDMVRGGFRIDWKPSLADTIKVHGDIFNGKTGERSVIPSASSPYSEIYSHNNLLAGGNILGRWERFLSTTSDIALQVHYDNIKKEDQGNKWICDTVGIDFQHRFVLGERQEVIWGLGYLFYHDDLVSTYALSFEPESENKHIFSLFIQDDITFFQEMARLTIGTKLEHNDYTDFEIQPNARLLLMPHEDHTFWAAVSRAVRTPARSDEDLQVTIQTIPSETYNTTFTLSGNNVKSEELIAMEFGYRLQATKRLNFDSTIFYNIYDNLSYSSSGAPTFDMSSQPPQLFIPIYVDDTMKGKTYGAEFAINWHPLSWWRFMPAYTYLKMDLQLKGEEVQGANANNDDDPPLHIVSVRSSMEMPKNLEFDVWFRYVDEVLSGNVDGYFTTDVRLGWNPNKYLNLSIVGQNLIESRHPEFIEQSSFASDSTEVQRSVYGKVTCKF